MTATARPLTPDDVADVVAAADMAIVWHTREAEWWTAIRRVALSGAVPPAALEGEVF